MTAALLQGVPMTTFDVDLWINLPARLANTCGQ